MKKAFTLLELVVVIIILGVLATLGITQYGRMVERARYAEVLQVFGDIRKLAMAYYLQNGTLTGMTSADINIGSAPDQIPGYYYAGCKPSHYFDYYLYAVSDHYYEAWAVRCEAGGKEPQGSVWYQVALRTDLVAGTDTRMWCSTSGRANCTVGFWP